MPQGGKKRRKGKAAAAVVFLFIPILAGAYYFGYNTGLVSIQVTDDEIAQFESLFITFDEIALHSTGTLTTAEWSTINLEARTIDLTKLSNNITSEVGLGRAQAGTYTQLRLIVASAQGVLKSGEHVVVQVPSGELKTETPFDLDPQGQMILVVRLLVQQTGQGFTLHPALGSIQQGP